MNDVEVELDDYLARYAGTLTSYDSQAAAGLWGSPGMILNDQQGAGVLESREAMASGLEQSYPLYRKLGLASVGYERLREPGGRWGEWPCDDPEARQARAWVIMEFLTLSDHRRARACPAIMPARTQGQGVMAPARLSRGRSRWE
ncbi:hypothetical protein ABZS99_45115 [Streptomyces sp. NPDC005463]|uniref:hypothetical protein n=1 Tax=Streptomyces sp. NPDC005463 TaxID=3154465 RepID=UPI0033B540DA